MIYINILLWLLTITSPLWGKVLHELLSEHREKELARISAENELKQNEKAEKDGSANRVRRIIIKSRNMTDPADVELINSISYSNLLLLHK